METGTGGVEQMKPIFAYLLALAVAAIFVEVNT